jgi:hypothetical protein
MGLPGPIVTCLFCVQAISGLGAEVGLVTGVISPDQIPFLWEGEGNTDGCK